MLGVLAPEAACLVGFTFLRQLFRDSAVCGAAQEAYNGSGPAAVKYASLFQEHASYWHTILERART